MITTFELDVGIEHFLAKEKNEWRTYHMEIIQGKMQFETGR
jgi:hypothetical protein